ncbi:hypothetical protein, partial [Mesorhizobium sp. B2-6-7]
MIKETWLALLETEEGRIFFRRWAKLAAYLLAFGLISLLAVVGYRAYNGASVKVWGLEIGQIEKSGDVSIHRNFSFNSKAIYSTTWSTNDACVRDIHQAFIAMQVVDRETGGTMVWGKTPNGWIMASCAGEGFASETQGDVIAFGHNP